MTHHSCQLWQALTSIKAVGQTHLTLNSTAGNVNGAASQRCWQVLLIATYILIGLWPTSGLAAPLAIGDNTPSLTFKDINKVQASTADYQGRIRVFSFADKNSSERLMAWMNDAGLQVMQKFPDISLAYINFADVTAVPSMFKGIVESILRKINNNSQEKLDKAYREAGISLDKTKISFHLTPDWDGSYLRQFGLENAEKYYVWVEANGKIVAALPEGTPNIIQVYIQVFEKIFANPANQSTMQTAN